MGYRRESFIKLPALFRSTFLAAAAVFVVVLFWMSASWGQFIFKTDLGSPYDQLAEAFLAGRLNIATVPDPRILALENPYNPAQRIGIYYPWDLSLYNGKYYPYWGPVPTLLLHLPYRLVTGQSISENLAIFFLSLLAVFGLFAVVYLGAKRFSIQPQGPAGLWLLYIAFASTIPLQLGGYVWVSSALAALVLQTLFIGCLIMGISSHRWTVAWTCAAGLMLTLAIASRITLALFYVAGMFALTLVKMRLSWKRLSMFLITFSWPVLLGGVALML